MGSGCFEGWVGQRICISFGLFLMSDKCNGLGSDGGRFGLEVNPADPAVGEPQLVRRTGLSIDGHGIAGKGRADRDGSSPVPDGATATHETHQYALGIDHVDRAARVEGAIRLVELRGCPHPESFVWPVVVEVDSPGITDALLVYAVRGSCGLDF